MLYYRLLFIIMFEMELMNMEYFLRNGETIKIREAEENDALILLEILDKCSRETRFLSRNPGEVVVNENTIEGEKNIIAAVKADNTTYWYVVEYNGEIVGQCSVRFIRNSQRYTHRAELGFMLIESACNLGIGGKMMSYCLDRCRELGVLQAELSVVVKNKRALKMYKGFGFKRVGKIPRALQYLDGSFADEYKMVKYLDE